MVEEAPQISFDEQSYGGNVVISMEGKVKPRNNYITLTSNNKVTK